MKRFVVIVGILLAVAAGVVLWQQSSRFDSRLADARSKVGTRAASPLLDQLAQDYPQEAEIPYLQARQARLAGQPRAVVTALDRAKRLNGPAAQINRERLLTLATVDPRSAAGELEQMLASRPDDPDVLLAVASLEMQAGHEVRTLTLVDRVIAADGANLFAHHLRGKCLLQTRHLAEARAELEAAVAGGPEHLTFPAARMDLAICLLDLGDFDRAHELFVAARTDDPSSLLAVYGVGRTASYLNRLDEAETAYRDILQRDPKHVETLLAMAQVVEDRGELSAAVAFLERVVQVEPSRIEAHARLAKLLTSLGNEKQAAVHEARYHELETARLKARAQNPELRP